MCALEFAVISIESAQRPLLNPAKCQRNATNTRQPVSLFSVPSFSFSLSFSLRISESLNHFLSFFLFQTSYLINRSFFFLLFSAQTAFTAKPEQERPALKLFYILIIFLCDFRTWTKLINFNGFFLFVSVKLVGHSLFASLRDFGGYFHLEIEYVGRVIGYARLKRQMEPKMNHLKPVCIVKKPPRRWQRGHVGN